MGNSTAKQAVPTTPKQDMSDWWWGTVLLTLFPLIASALVSLCTTGSIDFYSFLGDGDLVLSGYLITTPTIINLHLDHRTDRKEKWIFYFLLLAAGLQLVVYTSIKINTQDSPEVVYIASCICMLGSIFVAWLGQKRLRRG